MIIIPQMQIIGLWCSIYLHSANDISTVKKEETKHVIMCTIGDTASGTGNKLKTARNTYHLGYKEKDFEAE
jgi:hypothetical protein